MASFKMDGNKVANAIINAVVFVVETVVGLVFSIPSLFIARRDSAPRFRIGNKKKKQVAIAALLAIFTSVASLFFTMGDRPAKIDLTPELALGQGMAEETSRLLGNKGEIVVVKLNSKDRKGTREETKISAFVKTLSKGGGIMVTGMECLNMSPLDPPKEFDSAMFFAILEKYPKVSAIVSFVGAPPLTDEEIGMLDQNIPKVIVLENLRSGLRKFFEEGVIQVAIVRQRDVSLKFSKKPGTPRECFDQTYKVITTETASSLLP